MIEDTLEPGSMRFLNVLQGADAGVQQLKPVLLRTSSGTAFDGALIGDTAVLFLYDTKVVFTSTIYTVPSAIVHHYVSGLQPSSPYSVGLTAARNNVTLTLKSGCASMCILAMKQGRWCSTRYPDRPKLQNELWRVGRQR